MPARIDTQILIPALKGGHLDLAWFRWNVWKAALRAAGLEHRRPSDCRHTHISWALSAGIPAAKVALVCGTSLQMLSETYSHLVAQDVDDYRAALEAYGKAGGAVTSP